MDTLIRYKGAWTHCKAFFKVLTGGTLVPVDPFACPSIEGKLNTLAAVG